ncbi:uncharacterized protein LOC143225626 [Tachypleus tridentatus]|uniref:uncharacterized protein LOC143225626 n=1 Tax=Tachypleus tridentatus TaxID=6853 RepID=UPI003FD26DDA
MAMMRSLFTTCQLITDSFVVKCGKVNMQTSTYTDLQNSFKRTVKLGWNVNMTAMRRLYSCKNLSTSELPRFKFMAITSAAAKHSRVVSYSKKRMFNTKFQRVTFNSLSNFGYIHGPNVVPSRPNGLLFSTQTPGTNLTKEKLSPEDLQKSIDHLTEEFSETLALLEDARTSLGTIYITEDMKDAETKVNKTLEEFQNLLNRLNETQRTEVNRSLGLKMHELKAQLEMLQEMCSE